MSPFRAYRPDAPAHSHDFTAEARFVNTVESVYCAAALVGSRFQDYTISYEPLTPGKCG